MKRWKITIEINADNASDAFRTAEDAAKEIEYRSRRAERNPKVTGIQEVGPAVTFDEEMGT